MLPRTLNPRRDRTKNEATRKRSAATKEQTKRPGLFGGIYFFKQVIDEMKKVTYPTGSGNLTYCRCVCRRNRFSLAY